MAIFRAICDLYFIIHFTLTSVAVTSVVGTHFAVRSRTFHAAENRALEGFVYSDSTASSLSFCGIRCLRNDSCKSLNFFKHNKSCQLSNATWIDHLNDLSKIIGSLYLDVNGETPHFSVSDDDMYCNNRRSCKMVLNRGSNSSGVYEIYPQGSCDSAIRVYCDMELDGGGWTVFQRRQDGSVDFYRNWADYRAGFGNLSGEFWLGNDNLVALTSDDSRGTWEIRFDLWDWEKNTAWATYGNFQMLGPEKKYTLRVSNYDGTAGDSFSPLSGFKFSTMDRDNDNAAHDCADERGGGWWFDGCAFCNLNGKYSDYWGINWYHWKGNGYSLKQCTIMMRETDV